MTSMSAWIKGLVQYFPCLLPYCRPQYLSVDHGPHDGVKSALGDEVVHVDRGRLSYAVGSIFSLLDVAGVPVELGEHHMAGCGEGQTLKRTHTHTHNSPNQSTNTLFNSLKQNTQHKLRINEVVIKSNAHFLHSFLFLFAWLWFRKTNSSHRRD